MASAWGSSWGGVTANDGGLVGTISEGMTRALLIVNVGMDASLQYATTSGGTYFNLDGFVIHQDIPTEPVYDNSDRVASQTRRAYLKGPVTPALAIGYRIKDNTQTPPLIWAVEGVMLECQQIATLSRQERVGVAGPDRGASA